MRDGYVSWPEADIARLRELHAQGLSQRRIGLEMGRSKPSIRSALNRFVEKDLRCRVLLQIARKQPRPSRAIPRPSKPVAIDLAGYSRDLVVWAVRHKDVDPEAKAIVALVAEANRRIAA
jgi:hypothetical protein